MPKGLFTQSAMVLFEQMPDASAIAKALSRFEPRELEGGEGWMSGRHSFRLSMAPARNGFATVAAFDVPYPDSMGDPTTDPMLMAAWTMGFFGPCAFPGNFSRALQQRWIWDDAEIAARHRSFVRILTTYASGARPDDPVLPTGIDPFEELEFVTRLALALGALPGALAYFNPNGEILAPFETVKESLEHHRSRGLPAQDIWANVRMIRLQDAPGWMFMDSIGFDQWDSTDLEACFADGGIPPREVAGFIRNVGEYVRTSGALIHDGDTLDGPGGRWRSRHSHSLYGLPRHAIRMFPDGVDLPERLLPTPREW